MDQLVAREVGSTLYVDWLVVATNSRRQGRARQMLLNVLESSPVTWVQLDDMSDTDLYEKHCHMRYIHRGADPGMIGRASTMRRALRSSLRKRRQSAGAGVLDASSKKKGTIWMVQTKSNRIINENLYTHPTITGNGLGSASIRLV